ncbi:hypothetical protein DACRYDRAFT_20312 [Dacryopinax primogenitus]|uniref:Uncharacterized protein n=1 Tax=Dacryopinax primogenitus (strain DJM 731) TaxID=1858805 RepID=M5G345_DACPD|nr:uncharacterized protein DACRYDRAFT_20312 [Dacryopinax primogenitus]EJU04641.1 hypothetical protein DACRYDRAFT_20312 [Dacryopinax primogenitus]
MTDLRHSGSPNPVSPQSNPNFILSHLPAWASGCPSYNPTSIPSSVEASSIHIPSWAFLPDNGSSWNPQSAQAVATGAVTPTSLPTGAPSASTAPGATSSVQGGVIAGAAGGGVVLLLLLVLAAYYLLRRYRQAEPRSPIDLSDTPAPPDPSPYFLTALPRAPSRLGIYKPPLGGWGHAYQPVSTGWELTPSGSSSGPSVERGDGLGAPRSAPLLPPTPSSGHSGFSGASGTSTPNATTGHSPVREEVRTPALPTYEQVSAEGSRSGGATPLLRPSGDRKRPQSAGR